MMTKRLLRISKADDSKGYYSAHLEIEDESNESIESTINPIEYRNAHEPTIEALTDYLKAALGLKKRRRSYRYLRNANNRFKQPKGDFSRIIRVGESGFVVLFQRKGIRYSLMGKWEQEIYYSRH